MLSFDIAKIEAQAALVDGQLAADDPVWSDDDEHPTGPVHVTGRLSPAGSDRFYFSGHIVGAVEKDCRRCLRPVREAVNAEVHLLFADPGAVGAEDPDVFVLATGAREIDLRPAVREEWLLAAPAFVQCRADCPGFCPRCGADLSTAPCGCPPETDSRWDALRRIRGRAD